MRFGVPKGSVLGPVIFTRYTQPLVKILQQHNMSYHFYTDDTQLYKGASLKHITDLTTGLEHCVRDVKARMNSNKLKLNDDKTEIHLMKSCRHTINTFSVSINHTTIDIAEKTKSLGVIFNSKSPCIFN
ncbi:reverse transcriptase-like protein [Elysia marginata]|uniref:Reverse transcriptase-like protein n=1 Tax=Elysia marginata TaxID=1093978 RepID=A0AAV4EKZ1_9GAST|nr:reverse transcriptase-like protein [Elysia marginata]